MNLRSKDATRTDANSEFRNRGHIGLQLFAVALIAFMIIDWLCLPRLG